MDLIAGVSKDTVRLLFPTAGVLRIAPFDGDSGLADSGLSVHRAVLASGSHTAGVAVDPVSSWNRAAMRAVAGRSRFNPRRRKRVPGTLLDAAASTDPDVSSVHGGLTRAGWLVGVWLVASSHLYQTVQCEIWSCRIGESCRGYGLAAGLDAAILDAMLDATAGAVEMYWQMPTSTD